MTLSVTHAFVSAKGDSADTTRVRPSNWNAAHTMTMATARVLGRITSGTGAVEELTSGNLSTFLGLGSLATLSAVGTSQLSDDAVTYAKLQNVSATARLLGRYSASAGNCEEISIGAGLELTGAGVLQSTVTTTFPRGYIDGNILTNSPVDSVNDIIVGAGTCRDDSNTEDMTTASTLNKQLDAAWAVGNAQGGLDTGTKATSTWYHVWRIKRTDTGVVDALYSLSATSPTMPTNYTKKRRIGAVYVGAGGAITAFVQVGDEFQLVTPVADVNNTASHTTAVTPTMTVPGGVKVKAHLRATIVNGSGGNVGVLVSSPDETDAAPSLSGAPGASVCASGSGNRGSAELRVWTNTSSQIRYRADNASTDTIIVATGWTDLRGKDA